MTVNMSPCSILHGNGENQTFEAHVGCSVGRCREPLDIGSGYADGGARVVARNDFQVERDLMRVNESSRRREIGVEARLAAWVRSHFLVTGRAPQDHDSGWPSTVIYRV
jgi:hypothetical protein